jgi:putative acetyltransferase
MLSVLREPPRQNDVALLLKQSDDIAAQLYPGEYRQQLDPRALDAAGIHVLVARIESVAVGCCALIERGHGNAELKRMIVDEQARRQGVGMALLQAVEVTASILGIHLIQMEVGVRNADGQALYRRAGYSQRGPFGSYGPSSISLFFEKSLKYSSVDTA